MYDTLIFLSRFCLPRGEVQRRVLVASDMARRAFWVQPIILTTRGQIWRF